MPARTMALLRQLALLCLRAVCCNTGCFGKFSPRSCVLPITLIFIIVLVMQLGRLERIDPVEHEVTIRFDDRLVKYDFGELDEVALAYAVTIHKSQGSEFPAVVIPLATQHYMLLQRNLIYTGITRGKRLLVLIGQKKALGIAVRNDRPQRGYSGLLASLQFQGDHQFHRPTQWPAT